MHKVASSSQTTKNILTELEEKSYVPHKSNEWILPLNSRMGKFLLETAHIKDRFFNLAIHRGIQSNCWSCGPETVSWIFNLELNQHAPAFYKLPSGTFCAYWTCEQVLGLLPLDSRLPTRAEVMKQGLTLRQLGYLLALKLPTHTVHASTGSVKQLRDWIQKNLNHKNLIVNYDREALGQKGSGHISPIGAYNVDYDAALVFDVNPAFYKPFWVPLTLLYKSMDTLDRQYKKTSAKTRGWCCVG